MQFKHPEILYALFLLLIPILVHLFQLRRFQKVPFTNVKFLKEVTIQTRKSSQLKKWLTLLTRMLALATIIFAFAQPYFANRDITTTEKETVIYLDNSFSMEAKGPQGPLLQRAIQDLVAHSPSTTTFSLFTNEKTFRDATVTGLGNQLLQLPYSSSQLPIDNVMLKAQRLFSNEPNTIKELILISDFQEQDEDVDVKVDSLIAPRFVQLQPVNTNNVSIDSVYISKNDPLNLELTVQLSKQGEVSSLPVSLFDKETLIAKTSASFQNKDDVDVTFSIPANADIHGKITIDDNGLQFDNTLYFSTNRPDKIAVLLINESDDDFLKRIYTSDEFDTTTTPIKQLDYNVIESQNLIILNELVSIPNSLIVALDAFVSNGGKLLVIPSDEADINTYNQLLSNQGVGRFSAIQKTVKKMTTIRYAHPLMNAILENNETNFQYPEVQSYFPLATQNAVSALLLEDGNPFLVTTDNTFVFTTALNTENANFQSSQLIAPTFYEIGKNSLQLPQLYFNLGRENQFDVKVSLQQDEILSVENKEESIIPLQQNFQNKVTVTTQELPNTAGIFSLKNKDNTLQTISYNNDRSESDLTYRRLETLNFEVSDSVETLLEEIKSESEVNALWKWFAIFALLFLVIEMLILKYFK